MRTIVYKCDGCDKVLSDGIMVEIPHIHTKGSVFLAIKDNDGRWRDYRVSDSKESQYCIPCFLKVVKKGAEEVKRLVKKGANIE